MTSTISTGDCRKIMGGWANDGVRAHMVVTSPPYWRLRDYGVDGQLGLEPTLEEYIANLVEVFRCVWDVLRDDGTLWLNLASCHAGGTRGSDGELKSTLAGSRHNQRESRAESVNRTKLGQGFKAKDEIDIPGFVCEALRRDGWYRRQTIIWAKGLSFYPVYSGSIMPESCTDRPTSSFEYLFLMTKRAQCFCDMEAVREPGVIPAGTKAAKGSAERVESAGVNARPRDYAVYSGTRNLRSVWVIPTKPFRGATCTVCMAYYGDGGRSLQRHTDDEGKDHKVCRCGRWDAWLSHFATFPPALIEPCILAGTSERGCCPQCGAPWVREVETTYENPGNRTTNGARSVERRHESPGFAVRLEKRTRTLGWRPTCDHEAEPIPCTVLDPFMGSGTTAEVALSLGRRFLGCELNPAYKPMQDERIRAGWKASVERQLGPLFASQEAREGAEE